MLAVSIRSATASSKVDSSNVEATALPFHPTPSMGCGHLSHRGRSGFNAEGPRWLKWRHPVDGVGWKGSAVTSTFDESTFDEVVAERMLTANMDDGLPGFLGFRHVEFTAGRLRAEMDAKPELMTAFGNLHGGCISAFVDHCLGVLFYPMIPRGAWVATTEFKLNLLRAVNEGTCVAEATVLSMSRRQGVARIEVSNDDQLVCVA